MNTLKHYYNPLSDLEIDMTSNIFTLQQVSKQYKLQGQYFSTDQSEVTALSQITCAIPKHSIFGIVGESGSGKSTLMRLLIGLENPSSGSILYDDTIHIQSMKKKDKIEYQSQIKMIFQDPARSLNHRLTIEHILMSSLWYSPTFNQECQSLGIHTRKGKKQAILHRITNHLQQVGLDESILYRYPTEFSGGQRQRIAIVRALIHEPKVLICDEITASLDMSTRRNIIDLLISLKNTLHLSIIFVSHDLSLILYLCDEVMVLRNGLVKELASATQVFNNPHSDDTKQLLDALPRVPTE